MANLTWDMTAPNDRDVVWTAAAADGTPVAVVLSTRHGAHARMVGARRTQYATYAVFWTRNVWAGTAARSRAAALAQAQAWVAAQVG